MTDNERKMIYLDDAINGAISIQRSNGVEIYSDKAVPVEYLINLPSAQPEETCDTCKHGYFGDNHCDNCRVRYPSHYERRTE